VDVFHTSPEDPLLGPTPLFSPPRRGGGVGREGGGGGTRGKERGGGGGERTKENKQGWYALVWDR